MYYTQNQIGRANQADLVSFLQSQGEQIARAGQEYKTIQLSVYKPGTGKERFTPSPYTL